MVHPNQMLAEIVQNETSLYVVGSRNGQQSFPLREVLGDVGIISSNYCFFGTSDSSDRSCHIPTFYFLKSLLTTNKDAHKLIVLCALSPSYNDIIPLLLE